MYTQRGFTIIELLIVVTILALLAGIVAFPLNESQARARDARRAADLKSLQAALLAYKNAHSQYPSTNGAWSGDCPAYGNRGYDTNGYVPDLVPEFLAALPKDPAANRTANDAGYVYRSDGTDFKLLISKTPESYRPENPYFDPTRPNDAWQISTPNAYNW